ncbi:AMP-binding protein [Rhodococcus zopfii]|uniref:AMP-binding protein n=1 Tax=Rhodococcus zopfii TaxID=43772 RepID=A0ABU3WL15_9NOCA|nr:AMP-binding protein [Rhodococcus zopfii]
MYRTGDLVAWNERGGLEYIGRTDFQVKVRGFRIELGEIESVLRDQDTVGQAVVVVRDDAHLGEQLVAYLVPDREGELDLEAVKSSVARELPSYMVPSAWVVLEALPLNINGKLDRKALPAPVFEAVAFRAPATAIEQIVAAVFAEVLGVERVGLDDDFFALGGNSLVATQVTARLGAALDAQVPVRSVFEASTVAGLAAAVESHAGSGARVALAARSRPERVPLSLAQQRMWFLNRFDSGTAVNNIPVALRLSGALDVAALSAAVRDVVARHEVLRTYYPEFDGVGQQVVRPVADAPALQVERIEAGRVTETVAELIGTGFDVTAEVPFRAALLELSSNERILVLVAHHISADGFSMGPLARGCDGGICGTIARRRAVVGAARGAVRRLRAVAARGPRRRARPGFADRAAARLLVRHPRRDPGRAGPAHRPAPAGAGDLSRRHPPFRAAGRRVRRRRTVRVRSGGHAVHGGARRVRGAAGAAVRHRGHRDRLAGRRAR